VGTEGEVRKDDLVGAVTDCEGRERGNQRGEKEEERESGELLLTETRGRTMGRGGLLVGRKRGELPS